MWYSRTPLKKIWRMHIECWIPKATNTHTYCVKLTVHTAQLYLPERASILGLFGGTKNFELTRSILIFFTYLSETFFILRKTERDMIKDVHWTSCKVPVIFIRFLLNLNFLGTFSKNTQIPNFIQIRPSGAESFHADRRTDMKKLIAKSA
jgi:hypothetical protein